LGAVELRRSRKRVGKRPVSALGDRRFWTAANRARPARFTKSDEGETSMRSVGALGFAKSTMIMLLAGAFGSGGVVTGSALAHGGGHAGKRSAASPASHDSGIPETALESGARALSEHRFQEALALGCAARAAAQSGEEEAAALAMIVDACVETGRYEAAIDTLQVLVDAYPGLAALARVSYVRELHGDIAGAVDAMREAARAGKEGGEIAWCHAKLGELELLRGDLDAAGREAGAALAASPGYAEAIALRGRVCALRGDWSGAIDRYREAIEHRDDAGFLIELGEAYEGSGDVRAAKAAYDSARRHMHEDAAAGTDVDLERIALDLDHPAQAPAAASLADLLQRARALHERRPTVYADALLAELLARYGRSAEAHAAAERALRFGSRDPSLLTRAAIAFRAAGDDARAAQLSPTP
jgi:tetratricopeptide (TPR) repeat protein